MQSLLLLLILCIVAYYYRKKDSIIIVADLVLEPFQQHFLTDLAHLLYVEMAKVVIFP